MLADWLEVGDGDAGDGLRGFAEVVEFCGGADLDWGGGWAGWTGVVLSSDAESHCYECCGWGGECFVCCVQRVSLWLEGM